MFLVVTNTREHFLRYFALLRLTEALPLTMAEPLPEISREQADLLLRQIHAALGTPRAGDRAVLFRRAVLVLVLSNRGPRDRAPEESGSTTQEQS